MSDMPAPDISQIDTPSLPEAAFPAETAQPVPGELRIAVSERAYEGIMAHADEDTLLELCGVLVGDVKRDGAGPFVEVVAVIRGEHAQSHTGQVTFTHETWSHINEVKDRDYPEARIVGWYHSHPGLGVFLSQMDLFIHRNFFDQPWHVAFVVDPQSGEQAFFTWQEGEPTRGKRFWIAARERRTPPVPVPAEVAAQRAAGVGRPAPAVSRGLAAALAALCAFIGAALMLVATTFLGPLSAHEREQRAQIEKLTQANLLLLEQVAELRDKLDGLEGQLAAVQAPSGAAPPASPRPAASLIPRPPRERPARDGK